MEKDHVCPYWLGYFLINPMRKLVHNPKRILGTYIRPGMTVIDYGSAMGYFSLPLAKMVGKQGKVQLPMKSKISCNCSLFFPVK